MPAVRSVPGHVNVQIERRVCPKCHNHMLLAHIVPANMGFDLRTFECTNCEHVRDVIVETDAFGRP
jgi:uncharacterized protein (UPF0212 family)